MAVSEIRTSLLERYFLPNKSFVWKSIPFFSIARKTRRNNVVGGMASAFRNWNVMVLGKFFGIAPAISAFIIVLFFYLFPLLFSESTLNIVHTSSSNSFTFFSIFFYFIGILFSLIPFFYPLVAPFLFFFASSLFLLSTFLELFFGGIISPSFLGRFASNFFCFFWIILIPFISLFDNFFFISFIIFFMVTLETTMAVRISSFKGATYIAYKRFFDVLSHNSIIMQRIENGNV